MNYYLDPGCPTFLENIFYTCRTEPQNGKTSRVQVNIQLSANYWGYRYCFRDVGDVDVEAAALDEKGISAVSAQDPGVRV